MKKSVLRLAGLAIAAILAFEMSSCSSDSDSHEHSFATEWSIDAVYHWHAATCEHKDEVKDKAEHTFGEWTVTAAATEEAKGSRGKICSVCGYKVTEEIAKLDHKHEAGTKHEAVAGTCVLNGSIEYYDCKNPKCTAKLDKDGKELTSKITIEATGHAWDSGTVTTKAVCQDHDGEKTYNCTVCSETKKETIAKEATHTWGNGTITLKPKCGVSDGERTYTCAVCGETKKETVTRPDDHSWDKGVLTKMETDTPEKVFTCTVCDETYSYPMKKMAVTDFIAKIKETDGVKKITAEERTEPGITQTDSETVNVWRIVLTEYPLSTFPSKLETCDLTGVDTSNVTDMNCMFEDCMNLTSLNLSSFDTSNVTDMGGMFNNCKALTSLDLSSFDTGKVTNMREMFRDCRALTSLDLSKFNTGNVTDMSNMFDNCIALTSLNLSSFDTGKVTDMGDMFNNCKALTSLNLSSFDTGNVTNMKAMFYGCTALTSLDLSKFNTSNVTNMASMFNSCEALTSVNLSSFDTGKVTDMSSMFRLCEALTLLDLSSFNTTNVTDFNNMFVFTTSGIKIKYNSSIFKSDMVVNRNTITWSDVKQ